MGEPAPAALPADAAHLVGDHLRVAESRLEMTPIWPHRDRPPGNRVVPTWWQAIRFRDVRAITGNPDDQLLHKTAQPIGEQDRRRGWPDRRAVLSRGSGCASERRAWITRRHAHTPESPTSLGRHPLGASEGRPCSPKGGLAVSRPDLFAAGTGGGGAWAVSASRTLASAPPRCRPGDRDVEALAHGDQRWPIEVKSLELV